MQHKNIVWFLAFPKLYLPIKYYSIRVYNYQCACTNVQYSTIYSIKLTFTPTVSSLNFFGWWCSGRQFLLSVAKRNLSVSELGISQFPTLELISFIALNLSVTWWGILQFPSSESYKFGKFCLAQCDVCGHTFDCCRIWLNTDKLNIETNWWITHVMIVRAKCSAGIA